MSKPRSLARKFAGRTRLTVLAAFVVVLAIALPVFAAVQSANNGTSSPSLTITKPAGVVDGTFMLAQVAFRGDSTLQVNAPSGWTLVAKVTNTNNATTGARITQATYRKVAGPSEGANYQWTFGATGTTNTVAFGGITTYDDVDTANPIDVSATSPASNGPLAQSASPAAPSVTTTVPRTRLVSHWAFASGDSFTKPASMSLLYDEGRNTGSGGTRGRASAADEIQVATGATGPRTATFGASNVDYVSQTIALRRKPTHLGYTTPARSGSVDGCLGPITIQTQNAAGQPINPLAATEVTLASSNTGSYFNDPGCGAGTELTQANRTIGTGSTEFTFYYKPTAGGSHQITATAAGLQQAQQTETAKVSQTINWPDVLPASANYGDSFDVGSATASSGLSVTITPSGGCGPLSGSNTTVTSASTDCTLTASQAGDSTYEPAPNIVRTVVTDPRPIEVTADSGQSKVYSNNAATDPVFTYSVTSGSKVSGDNFTGALTRVAGETVAGSPYAINQGTLSLGSNYTLSFVSAGFNITKKELSVNANTAQKTYGSTDPSLTANLTGFVSGQNKNNSTTGTESCSRTPGETVAGSPYTITCTPGTLDAANYSFATGTTANFTINRKQINVNASPASKTYGEADPTTFTGTLSGFVNGEDATSAGVTGEKSCSRAPGETVAGSPYTITCTAGTLAADNYSFATGTTANFTINKKQLTVDANPGTKVYGAPSPTATATLNGFEFGEDETSAGVTGTADCQQTGTDKDVGTYTDVISCAPGTLAADNYSFTTGDTNDLTITPKELSVDANPASKTYGQSDPAFDATLTGFEFGENRATGGVTGAEVCSRSGTDEDAGTYTDVISCTTGDLDATNYTFAVGDTADFTINKKQLDIDANPDSKTYGQTDPTFTGTLSGFVSGEDETSANVTGAANCTRTGSQEDVGTYTGVITCAQGTLDADNYSFASGDAADFTIDKKQLDIDANPDSKTYGQTDPTFTGTLSGFEFGEDEASANVTGAANCTRTGSDEDVDTYTDVITCAQGTLDADNYSFATGDAADFTIDPKQLTVDADPGTKVYGAADPTFTATLNGFAFGENRATGGVTGTESCSRSGTDEGVGTYNDVLSCTAGTLDADNYTFTSGDTNDFTITKKTVSASYTVANKEYDRTTDATVTGSDLDETDLESGDVVTLVEGTATFADRNAGDDKATVPSGFSLDGADKDNYSLSLDPETANITQKAVDGSFTAADKEYDGTTAASASNRSVDAADVISPDVVTLTGGTATFDNENVGDNKTVTLSGATLGGADGANYMLSGPVTDQANITAKQVTGHFTADNKVYDGDADATVSDRSVTGAIGAEDVDLDGGTATFDNKNVGDNKTVTLSGASLIGADKDNYVLAAGAITDLANITAKGLTVSGVAAQNKVYDGSPSANLDLTGASLTGVEGTDDVSIASSGNSATFNNKNRGNGKPVTATIALDGTDAGNYSVTPPAGLVADITPKTVTGSFSAANKVYNGSSAATVTSRSLSGVVGTDDVSLSGGTASFANPNAGNNKTVTLTGAVLDPAGVDVDNYTLGSVATDTANITKRGVTGHFTAADKDFDGTKNATITGRSLTGVLSGDDVSLSGGVAGFVDEGPGVDITVLGFSFTLAGADAGNYSLSGVDSTTATINQRDPGDTDNPPSEDDIEQGATDKLGGDVKALGTDFAGLAFGFAPGDQGKKLDPTNQALFAIGCTDDCDISTKKTVVLTTGAGASAAATKKLKLKTQTMSLAEGELGVVKLKLTKKQKKAIKKAKKAKLVTKTTVTSGAQTASDKKSFRLNT